MLVRIKQFLLRLFLYEHSAHKLAVACSLATYIAFSPFLGFHTIMLVASGFLFRLNVPVLIAVGYTINNPFTMIPVYMGGYLTGYWILHSWWGIAVSQANPWWMQSVNGFLHTHLHIPDVSFWAFLLGGNILGVMLALVSYPTLYKVFVSLSASKSRAN